MSRAIGTAPWITSHNATFTALPGYIMPQIGVFLDNEEFDALEKQRKTENRNSFLRTLIRKSLGLEPRKER